jgi:quinoprotein glucose dehydrogenase
MQPRSLLVTCAFYSVCVATVCAQKADVGWKDYLGGPGSEHYSPLRQINVSNVNKIEVAWTYPAGDGSSTFCPLAVDNIVYISAKGGALVALDAHHR